MDNEYISAGLRADIMRKQMMGKNSLTKQGDLLSTTGDFYDLTQPSGTTYEIVTPYTKNGADYVKIGTSQTETLLSTAKTDGKVIAVSQLIRPTTTSTILMYKPATGTNPAGVSYGKITTSDYFDTNNNFGKLMQAIETDASGKSNLSSLLSATSTVITRMKTFGGDAYYNHLSDIVDNIDLQGGAFKQLLASTTIGSSNSPIYYDGTTLTLKKCDKLSLYNVCACIKISMTDMTDNIGYNKAIVCSHYTSDGSTWLDDDAGWPSLRGCITISSQFSTPSPLNWATCIFGESILSTTSMHAMQASGHICSTGKSYTVTGIQIQKLTTSVTRYKTASSAFSANRLIYIYCIEDGTKSDNVTRVEVYANYSNGSISSGFTRIGSAYDYLCFTGSHS